MVTLVASLKMKEQSGFKQVLPTSVSSQKHVKLIACLYYYSTPQVSFDANKSPLN